MITLKKHINRYPDLFLNERSACKRLSILLTPDYHDLSLEELINEANDILDLEDTIISDKKKLEYKQNFKKQRSRTQFQFYLTNIMMKGGNMSLADI